MYSVSIYSVLGLGIILKMKCYMLMRAVWGMFVLIYRLPVYHDLEQKESQLGKQHFARLSHARMMSSTTKSFSLITVPGCYGTQIKYKCFRPALNITDKTIRKVFLQHQASSFTTYNILKGDNASFLPLVWHTIPSCS